MKKYQRGFSLVEVLLAVSLFVLIAGVFVGAIIYGEQTISVAGRRARATELADEALEAVRNIRDAGFAGLQDGTYGLSLQSNTWTLTPGSDTVDIFTRQITISSVADSTSSKDILATITWQQDAQRQSQLTAGTRLTDWRGN